MRALLAWLILIAPAWAAFPETVDREALAALKMRIEAGDAAGARIELLAADGASPGDADILNLLGYASRKLGDLDASRTYYQRALRIDPGHRGALEYFGELELQAGDVAAARDLLARLGAVCPDGCEELDDLREAFAARGLSP
ncbi:MAG: tetratricopeptide repeat protein [Pseudomonadota bacterium]